MRILIINYYYPPVVDAHAYRWEQIANLWVLQGHQVDVITGSVHGVTAHTIESGVNVSRIGIFKRNKTNSSPLTILKIKSNLSALIKQKLTSAARSFYRKLYWPDGLWHWIPSALWEVLKRRSVKYDFVVSYSPCFGSHLVALIFSKLNRSYILNWVADYGDPFSVSDTMPPNNFNFYNKLNFIAERLVISCANSVVFTNDATKLIYHSRFPINKIFKVIPHAVDIDRFYAGTGSVYMFNDLKCKQTHRSNIVYIGGFHRGIREPYLLFELARLLEEFTPDSFMFNIYGPDNGFDLASHACQYIKYHGMVDREHAVQLCRGADVLVNVDNLNCIMAPSKIVEYIATGRPLVNLTESLVKNKVIEIYEKAGFAFTIDKIILEKSIALVASFLKSKQKAVASEDIVKQTLYGYTIDQVSRQYIEL